MLTGMNADADLGTWSLSLNEDYIVTSLTVSRQKLLHNSKTVWKKYNVVVEKSFIEGWVHLNNSMSRVSHTYQHNHNMPI